MSTVAKIMCEVSVVFRNCLVMILLFHRVFLGHQGKVVIIE